MPNCSFQDDRTACVNYVTVNELDNQSVRISNTLLSRDDKVHCHGQSNLRLLNSDSYCRENMEGDSTRSCKADHNCKHVFGKCLLCGKFHSSISCSFRIAKCFKCGKI